MGYIRDPHAIMTDLVGLITEHYEGDETAFLKRCDRIARTLDEDGDDLSMDASDLIFSTAHRIPPQIVGM